MQDTTRSIRPTGAGPDHALPADAGRGHTRPVDAGPRPAHVTGSPAEAAPHPSESASAVELRGVTKRFGSQTAVDDLTLSIPRGQVLALLGPNGAGKSTTTEMILGLQQPDAGSVTVLGRAPHEACHDGLVGAMLQSGALLDEVTVATMLRLVAGVCAHPLPLSDVVEIADIASLLRKSTSKLSGGEAQRVRFALALLPDPEVILLDEPTVAMDVETRRRFWERMRHVASTGRTIVFATHYLEEADEQADRVVVIDRGRLVADGTGAQIKDRIGGRTICAALTAVHGERPNPSQLVARLADLPGVTSAAALGEDRIRLACSDSDQVLRALYAPGGVAADGLLTDLTVASPSLEDAFVQLTSHHDDLQEQL